ncbi:hypothetical protein Tco_1160085, partial [Tanacetum coccineum]
NIRVILSSIHSDDGNSSRAIIKQALRNNDRKRSINNSVVVFASTIVVAVDVVVIIVVVATARVVDVIVVTVTVTVIVTVTVTLTIIVVFVFIVASDATDVVVATTATATIIAITNKELGQVHLKTPRAQNDQDRSVYAHRKTS